MWRNYLTVGIRALVKSRTYAFINIFGLAIGLAACLMLLLYVRYETSYDAWLPNSENIYQLQSHYVSKQTGEESRLQMTSYVAGQRLRQDFPRDRRDGLRAVERAGDPAQRRGAAHRGRASRRQSLLRHAAIPARPGRSRAPRCRRPATVVLTQSEARRMFGTDQVIGRTLTMVSRGNTIDYRITGIARDVPHNSHVRFTIVARIDIPAWSCRARRNS